MQFLFLNIANTVLFLQNMKNYQIGVTLESYSMGVSIVEKVPFQWYRGSGKEPLQWHFYFGKIIVAAALTKGYNF